MDKTEKTNSRFNEKASPLSVTTVNGQEVHIVTLNPRSLALLKKAFEGVYQEAFPIKEEQDTLEMWLAQLQGKNPQSEITITIAGENLNSDTPVIKALSVFEYFPKEDVGLVRFSAVGKDCR